MTAGGGHDPAGEGKPRGLRRVRRQPRDRAQKRHEQDVRVRQTRRRIAGHPEKRNAAGPGGRGPRSENARECGRLAGADRDAVEDHLAARRDGVDDEIAIADGAAAGKHNQIGASASVERRDERLGGVSYRTVGLCDAAVRGDHRAEREAIDVEDLSRRERVSRLDDLVARRQNRDARFRKDVRRRDADGGKRAHASRRQLIARCDDAVAARDVGGATADILPCGRRRQNVHLVVRRTRRLFDHDDRVGARRQRRARRDLGACAGRDGHRRWLARVDPIDHPQPRRRRARRAGDVSGHDGVAVHRRSRERRHVERRHDVRGRDASGRSVEIDALGPLDRPHRRVEPSPRFVQRNGRSEGSHFRKQNLEP